MTGKSKKYYLVRESAVPDVLLRVVDAKKLLETGKAETVNEAAELVGISRSSFYKYKEDILPFHESMQGKTLTFVLQVEDKPGLLSAILKRVAEYHVNILTVHQAIPTGGIASLTLSVEIFTTSGDVQQMIQEVEELEGVQNLKILGE